MKALLLAGGTGTRLGSLTYATNKHLLPVGDKPMIMHGLDFLDKVGIDEVLIVTGYDAIGPISSLVKYYQQWDRRVYYAAQAGPAGIADAIKYGKQFCGDDRFMVLLGDNIMSYDNIVNVQDALHDVEGAHIWTVKLPDVTHCGVLNLDENDRPIEIEEKPRNPKSDLAITGCYVFDKNVWGMIGSLIPSRRGEYEVTDILNWYIDHNTLKWSMYNGHWMDLGHSLQSYYTESLRMVQ